MRALFNESIAEKTIKESLYPFGKRKYQIPKSSNVKKALPHSDIGKIFNYEPQHKDEAMARDLWIFSFICNGINIKDIAKLKYENISGETITFLRSKTLRTSRKNLQPIVALITPDVSLIIQKWGNQPRLPHSYVFPILSNNDNLEQQEAKITNITRSINHYMKKIGDKLGINKKITTYVARHSYATIMVEKGAPIALISEDLGHKGIGTTQLYIGNLETSEKKKYINYLTDFGGKAKNKK